MAVVNVKFDITTAQITKITDYLSYQTEIDDGNGNKIPNPETRKVFLYGKVKDWLRNNYLAQKSKDGETARVAALAEGETELINLDVSE